MIKFIFHTCNGAYCDFHTDDTDSGDIKEDLESEQDVIADKILNKSFIGQFRSNMIEFGYDNIMVTGYRGFYQTMNNGSGIRVGNKYKNPTQDIDCKQVEYTIYPDGNVDIPKHYDFEVESDTDSE